MRDSFGGVFMLNLFLVFIFIYVAFTAVSLNYAKAFRLKNSIIDFIETNEIVDLGDDNFKSKLPELQNIVENAGYFKECQTEGEIEGDNGIAAVCYYGVLIRKDSQEAFNDTNTNIIKYTVTTCADWDVGALNKILALGGKKEDSEESLSGVWKVYGEAKVVSKIEN